MFAFHRIARQNGNKNELTVLNVSVTSKFDLVLFRLQLHSFIQLCWEIMWLCQYQHIVDNNDAMGG